MTDCISMSPQDIATYDTLGQLYVALGVRTAPNGSHLNAENRLPDGGVRLSDLSSAELSSPLGNNPALLRSAMDVQSFVTATVEGQFNADRDNTRVTEADLTAYSAAAAAATPTRSAESIRSDLARSINRVQGLVAYFRTHQGACPAPRATVQRSTPASSSRLDMGSALVGGMVTVGVIGGIGIATYLARRGRNPGAATVTPTVTTTPIRRGGIPPVQLFFIGRGDTASVRVDATPSISGNHVEVEVEERRYRIRDIGRNPGLVEIQRNGTRIPVGHPNFVPLQTGDVLRIGSSELRFDAALHVDSLPGNTFREVPRSTGIATGDSTPQNVTPRGGDIVDIALHSNSREQVTLDAVREQLTQVVPALSQEAFRPDLERYGQLIVEAARTMEPSDYARLWSEEIGANRINLHPAGVPAALVNRVLIYDIAEGELNRGTAPVDTARQEFLTRLRVDAEAVETLNRQRVEAEMQRRAAETARPIAPGRP